MGTGLWLSAYAAPCFLGRWGGLSAVMVGKGTDPLIVCPSRLCPGRCGSRRGKAGREVIRA